MLRFTLAAAAAAVAVAQPFGPVNNLPGWNGNISMYSGYMTVNATNGRALFFWLVESSNPTSDELVFWTNGGPGCSSVSGMLTEHGPFRPDPSGNGNLVANPWSWHQEASMLYVEHPAGVGFSYSNTTSDYVIGDAQDSLDIYNFLQGFYAAFPQYRSQKLVVTGESYGGHYVPNIAKTIVEQNMLGQQPTINFAGFAVGNPWTVAYWDNIGAASQWYWQGMISNDSFSGILATCNMSDVGPLMATLDIEASRGYTELHAESGIRVQRSSLGYRSKLPERDVLNGAWALPSYKGKTCNDWTNQADTELGSNTDIYALYSDMCLANVPPVGSNSSGSSSSMSSTLRRRRQAKQQHSEVAVAAKVGAIPDSTVAAGCEASYVPCIDALVASYLNRADVQAALYVLPATIPGGSWMGCSSLVTYSYDDLLSSMIPVYDYLFAQFPQGSYMVFSGTHDGIVPHTGTRYWLESMQLPYSANGAFQTWNTPAGQVGGHTFTLQAPTGATLTYAGIRGAGHLCPALQASRSLQLFQMYLATL